MSVLLTARQVAEKTGYNTRTIYNWAAAGLIRSYRANRSVRFVLDEVLEDMRVKDAVPSLEIPGDIKLKRWKSRRK